MKKLLLLIGILALYGCGGGGGGGSSATPTATATPTPTPIYLDGIFAAFTLAAGVDQNVAPWSFSDDATLTFDGTGSVTYDGIVSESGIGANQPNEGTGSYTDLTANEYFIQQQDGSEQKCSLNAANNFSICAKIDNNTVQKLSIGLKTTDSNFDANDLNGSYVLVTLAAGGGSWSAVGKWVAIFSAGSNYNDIGSFSKTNLGFNLPNSKSGTYTVNSDGKITIITAGGATTGDLSASGDVFIAANVMDENEQSISFAVKAESSGFSESSLSGTYRQASFSAREGVEFYSDYGEIIFDGTGGFDVDVTYSDTAVAAGATDSYSGIYTVSDNGSFEVPDLGWKGHISPDTKTVIFAVHDDAIEQTIGIAIK